MRGLLSLLHVGNISGDLLEERIRAVQADLTITLTNLLAGTYTFTGFHHDVGGTANRLPFDIFVDEGSGERMAAAVVNSIGSNPVEVAVSSFRFQTTGAPVIFRIGRGSFPNLINPVINGFTVVAVPEPSSAAIAIFAFAALAAVACSSLILSRGLILSQDGRH